MEWMHLAIKSTNSRSPSSWDTIAWSQLHSGHNGVWHVRHLPTSNSGVWLIFTKMGVPVQVSFTGTVVKQLYRSLPVCTSKNAQLYSQRRRVRTFRSALSSGSRLIAGEVSDRRGVWWGRGNPDEAIDSSDTSSSPSFLFVHITLGFAQSGPVPQSPKPLPGTGTAVQRYFSPTVLLSPQSFSVLVFLKHYFHIHLLKMLCLLCIIYILWMSNLT